MNYHLQLTGYVGSSTFSAANVRKVLAQYPGKHVDILIDSFGGSLPEGLSICGAIRDHGDVTVHFRGMNASAATIASMGAKKIMIAPESMYLVHKVSMGFFDWASRNADQLDEFIKALQSTKDDLDTMDRSIAEVYASRCKRPAKDLLDLMKAEKWISADDALAWGFVDGITEAVTVDKPSITEAQASAFRSLGLPLPPVDVEPESRSLIQTIIEPIVNAIKSLKHKDDMNPVTQPQNEVQNPETTEGVQPVTDSAASQQQTDRNPDNSALQAEIDRLKAENEALKKKTPGATTADVVASATTVEQPAPKSPFQNYIETSVNARKLFDSIP